MKKNVTVGYIIVSLIELDYELKEVFNAMDVIEDLLEKRVETEFWNEDVICVMEELGERMELDIENLCKEMYWTFDMKSENEVSNIYEAFMRLKS
ncbi:hypothetical protein [Bacillus thuringiensis]|uniref:hypothetical protein n=1 Tax=Bacillus thuringiensis TaxID=1428 RepID=UPI0005CDDADE|nr:hypothetical protein [Bacillus thuringiensis]